MIEDFEAMPSSRGFVGEHEVESMSGEQREKLVELTGACAE